MRYHGNYCGPNWSAGKHQPSVVSDVPAIDAFDDTCRVHDAHYALGHNIDKADSKFVWENIGRGVKRSIAAVGVFGNSTTRKILYGRDLTDDVMIDSLGIKKMGYSKAARSSVATFAPPTIVGTGIRLAEPVVSNTKNGIIVTGSEMIPVTVASTITTAWNIVTAFRLSPVHYGAGRLGRFAQLYEEFKFSKCSLAYVTAVGTSTLGNVIVEYMANSADPNRKFASSTFLQNVMTSGNGTLMPIWKNFTLELPLNDTKFHPMSSDLTFPDQNDASAGDVIVYQKNAVTSTDPGFYVMNYKIEFRGATLNPRLTSIPYATGNSQNWHVMQFQGPVLVDGTVVMAPSAFTQMRAKGLNTGGLLPDTIYKVVLTSVPWTANVLNAALGNPAYSANLHSYTRGGSQAIPDIQGLGGYTCYVSTNNQTGSVVPGSFFSSMAGAITGSDGGDNASNLIEAKDAIVNSSIGAACTFIFTAWVIPINFNYTKVQAND